MTLTLGSVVAGIVPDLESRHFSVQGDIGNRFDVVAGQSADEWHIHLKAGEILEHETETQIILRVTADDGVNAPYQTGDITINVRDINNHAPILASNTPMSVEISESRTDADPPLPRLRRAMLMALPRIMRCVMISLAAMWAMFSPSTE